VAQSLDKIGDGLENRGSTSDKGNDWTFLYSLPLNGWIIALNLI